MKVLTLLRSNILLIVTVLAVVVGVVVGVICRQFTPTEETIRLVKFPGELFLRMLRLLMLPLVVASMITGLGSMKGAVAGRIGLLAMLYYIATTVIALLISLALVHAIKPGSNSPTKTRDITQAQEVRTSGTDMVLDAIRNVFPDNIIGAAIQHTRTITTDFDTRLELTNASVNGENAALNMTRRGPLVLKKTVVMGGINIVGILTYSVVFGVFLSRMGRHGSVVLRFFNAINTITLNMIQLAMCSAALPVTIRCMEKKLKVSHSISKFVLPIGATVNMDAGAIYYVCAPVFIAQYSGVSLSVTNIIIISLIAILGSIGAAGVPGTGITALLLVLNAVGLPDTGISYLVTIDWLTDRIRTSVNVAGDCLAVGVVSHFTKKAFAKSTVLSLEEQDEDSNSCANENDIIVL
ncbi:excitatory amino acid transporter 3-like [Haliotis rubra]|uniref:excitatory amino acid transporter 3-like n=1 Tax=Haliotis rubra TaxID=36100 RepID=UPI001EE55701|nr:excitatory amino acid transporter 3-like [Haliotis rubra]